MKTDLEESEKRQFLSNWKKIRFLKRREVLGKNSDATWKLNSNVSLKMIQSKNDCIKTAINFLMLSKMQKSSKSIHKTEHYTSGRYSVIKIYRLWFYHFYDNFFLISKIINPCFALAKFL